MAYTMAQPKQKTNRKKIKSTKKQQKERFQLFGLFGLALVALFMAIGFAAYTQTLNINDTANVGASVWSVKWDASSFADPQSKTASHNVTDSTVTATCNNLDITATANSTCYFYIDAQNTGTYDAKLSTITISGPTAAQQKYTVVNVYDDANTPLEFAYSTNTAHAGLSPVTAVTIGTTKDVSSENVTLSKNTSKEFCIEIDLFQPDNASDLPSASQSITVSIALKWDQV